MRPYTEKIISRSEKIRRFDESVSDTDLEWHRDIQDRVVEVINGNGWMLQMDNQVPTEMVSGKSYFIESRSWHRIIKGKGELVLKIVEEKKDQNQDGENDFDDVKIARMKASGMSDEEIKKKNPELFNEEDYERALEEDLESIFEKKKRKKRRKRKAPSKNRKNPSQYDAPQGSDRDKGLDDAAAAYAAGDIAKAAKIRNAMEKKARSKKGYRSKPRKDTGKYTEATIINSREEVSRLLEDIVEEVKLDILLEELEKRIDEKKRKKKRKKSKSAGKLSKAVKKSLDKKADKRCLTRGSVYSEFRKGLAAYLSSGSRKGMSAHQWAHARVNSANPSKSWATVKKRKKCPSKKKKKK